MKHKSKMSMSTRLILVMVLLTILIAFLIVGYIYLSNAIGNISATEDETIKSQLEVVEGLMLVLIFLTVSFVLYLSKSLFDIYSISRENQFIVEINKMTSKIDQQTDIEKLDFFNDRFIKLVSNYASNSKQNLNDIYSALIQTYMLKSMKTEKDFQKIKMYTNILMKAYAESYNMNEIYTKKRIEKIADAAVMYDIGKLGTPGYILYKEANLSLEDFEIAKRHAIVGYELSKAISPAPRQGSFEQYVQDIAGYHHERYDGTGYPWGIKGEEIPFIARIIALVTTYDTIVRDRPYRKAMTHEDAVLLINSEKSRYFDPKIVKVFNGIEREFKKIKELNL